MTSFDRWSRGAYLESAVAVQVQSAPTVGRVRHGIKKTAERGQREPKLLFQYGRRTLISRTLIFWHDMNNRMLQRERPRAPESVQGNRPMLTDVPDILRGWAWARTTSSTMARPLT
jgi:hypothetical protein